MYRVIYFVFQGVDSMGNKKAHLYTGLTFASVALAAPVSPVIVGGAFVGGLAFSKYVTPKIGNQIDKWSSRFYNYFTGHSRNVVPPPRGSIRIPENLSNLKWSKNAPKVKPRTVSAEVLESRLASLENHGENIQQQAHVNLKNLGHTMDLSRDFSREMPSSNPFSNGITK